MTAKRTLAGNRRRSTRLHQRSDRSSQPKTSFTGIFFVSTHTHTRTHTHAHTQKKKKLNGLHLSQLGCLPFPCQIRVAYCRSYLKWKASQSAAKHTRAIIHENAGAFCIIILSLFFISEANAQSCNSCFFSSLMEQAGMKLSNLPGRKQL